MAVARRWQQLGLDTHMSRRSLFTSCRVARDHAHPDRLSGTRRTVGIDSEGLKFDIEDDWKVPADAHRVLSLPGTRTITLASIESGGTARW